jgi:nuclear transport factor 2 (NTF2) superfamily protein
MNGFAFSASNQASREDTLRASQTKQSISLAYRDPARISTAYTPDSIWRNRDTFIKGTDEIIVFLTAKWKRERSYRLRKELFAFTDNRIAVQFWYEYQDASDEMRWKRCYGLEDWTFDYDTGKMRKRQMSGNDVLVGPDGNGEGRWFLGGIDVDDAKISEEHWWRGIR